MDISKPSFWTFRFLGAWKAAFDEKVFLSPHVENRFLGACVCALALQAPLSMGFSRQEVWNGLPFPPPGDLPNPGMETESPVLAGRFFITEPPREPHFDITVNLSYKSSTGTPIRVPCVTTVYVLRLKFMKIHLPLCSVAR